MSKEQYIQFRLVVSKQHSGPQFLPRLAFQQALRVLNLKPHTRVQQHSPFEGTRSCPLSQTTISHNVQTSGCDGAVGSANDKSGEGSGAAGVIVDVLVLDKAGDDVEGLGGQKDGNGCAEEEVGEDCGEGHDVGAVVLLSSSWE